MKLPTLPPRFARACRLALLTACLAPPLLAPRTTLADAKWTQSSAVWKAIANCNKAAIKAFPDYTRDSLAKREAFRRKCLRSQNLPGGDDPPPRSH